MAKRTGTRWLVVGAAVVAGLISARCTSPEQKAMKRSTEFLEALKQRSIPGLPPALTTEQAMDIERGRTGPGSWFVETGCFACHAVSVYGVKSLTQMGPDLSMAVDDVEKRFGRKIDDFWHTPNGTMTIVRTQMIKMSPEEEATGLQKIKDAYAEYKRKKEHPEDDKEHAKGDRK